MWSYLSVRHSRSMNTLSMARPTPSIEIATPASLNTEVKLSRELSDRPVDPQRPLYSLRVFNVDIKTSKFRRLDYLRYLSKAAGILLIAQFCVWAAFGPVGASTSSAAGSITQANLTKLINASLSVTALPSSAKPSLSTLSSGGDVGYESLLKSSCDTIGTGQWKENILDCYFGDTKSDVTVALVGDSRASMYLDTFASLGKLEHFKVLFLAKDGCPSPLGTYMTNNDGTLGDAPWTACSKFHSYEISQMTKIKPKAIVISSNTEIALTNPVRYLAAPEVESHMVAFLSKLPAKSRVIVLGGFPQPAEASNPTVCLSRNPSDVKSCAFTPSAGTLSDNAAFASAAAASHDVFVNQTPWFCTSACPAVVGSYIPYTVDAYHADATYLQFVSGVLRSSIEPYIK
ncbi:MAG: putative acyltransferase [Acidimicrobiaceae bacterium]|nr:putative acyltransferase [Acidimicrobiaceae bacterium]